MAKRTSRHLTRRSGSNNYYVRVAVPLHLQSSVGRKEIWRSLGTADLREAKSRVYAEIASIQRGWHNEISATTLEARIEEPSRPELEAAARKYYQMQVEADLDERVHDPEMVRQFYRKKRFQKEERQLSKAFALGDYSSIDIEYWAEVFGFRFVPGSLLEREFAQFLMRADIEATRRFADHDKGVIGAKPKDKFFSKSSDAIALGEERDTATSPDVFRNGLSFSDLYDLHRLQLAGRLKEDTLAQRWKCIRRFAEYVGSKVEPVGVTKAMARDWRNALREWPMKADQRSDFKGLDFGQVLARNNELGFSPISARTRAKYVSEVSAFFTWARREGYVEKNPFDDLHEQLPNRPAKSRTFTDAQLGTLFSSPLFVGFRSEDARGIATPGETRACDWRFWLPILAAFTGARQGELAQLELADVREKEGIQFLRITNQGEDPLKSLKNAYSRRSIPLHSRVLELGFIPYVERIRSSGSSQIFPELLRDKRGAFADVSKFYQKYFRWIGLNKEEDRRIVFHSFRHRFTDELRRSFTEHQIKPLLGHSGVGTTGGYGEKEALSLQVRREMIETVSYGNVDWDALLLPGSPHTAQRGY